MSDIQGYKEYDEKIFKIVKEKQSLYEYKFDYFNLNEKKN